MGTRKYSVDEIDALRRVCQSKRTAGNYRALVFFPHGGPCADEVKAVEEHVRTCMLAGFTAEDLIASEHRPSRVQG